MKHYKDNNGNVYGYDDAQEVPSGLTLMSDEEFKLLNNPTKTPEQIEAEIKAEAQAYLNSTDWYVTRKFERGIEIPSDVSTKRAEAIEVLNQ